MHFRFRWGVVLSLLLATLAHADPEEVMRAKLKAVIPDAEVVSISPSPIAGMYRINARDYEPILMSGDGRYMIQGELLEVRGDKLVSVEDQALAETRKRVLATVKPADMVIFPATGKTKEFIYVFTDVDCGYCRRLHSEIAEINKQGIEVRYLAFPRSGPDSPSAAKLSSVWCAKDRRTALTQAKRGVSLPPAPALCKSPVKAQFQMGVDLGVRGTPAMFDKDGMQIGGYLPPDELAKTLGVR